MTFVAIDIVPTQRNKPCGTAYVNPAHVVAVARPRKNPDGLTEIFLNSRGENGFRRSLVTAQDLQQILTLLGPFIEIRGFETEKGDEWPVWHVRASAVVALKPGAEGSGRLYLEDGTDMWVTYADVAASVLRAPPVGR
jgi:hypothetical protein